MLHGVDFTTHDLDEAEKLADRILILHHSRIVANGSADALARQVAGTAEVRWTQDGQRHVHAGPMNTTSNAVACGLKRGRVEFGNSLRAGQDITYYVIVLVVLWFNRNETLPGTEVPVALFFLPGLPALQVVFSAAFGVATVLATEREDGTLLRLKSVPGGMTGYVVGQMVRTTLEIAFSITILLIPASFFVSGLSANGITGWMEAIGYLLLGLLAVLPLGFVIGSIFKNPPSVGGWGMLVMGAIIWVSGIFTPLAGMAGWVQVLGQLTPPPTGWALACGRRCCPSPRRPWRSTAAVLTRSFPRIGQAPAQVSA